MHATPLPIDPTQALQGAWHLMAWRIQYSDLRPDSFPYGPDALGLIVYTADGYMSACIAKAGRAALASASVRSASADEQVAAFASYFQYAGRYRVERAESSPSGWQVVHSVAHSLNPNFVGTEQRRDITWHSDGHLTLSAQDTLPGSEASGAKVTRLHSLDWRRA